MDPKLFPLAWIREAIRTLGVSGRVTELPAGEAAEVRQQVEAKFLNPGLDYWWERMKSGMVFWMTKEGWRPLEFIHALCPDTMVWFFPVYDDQGEVFQAPRDLALKILAESNPSEYALVAPGLEWIVIVNHHDAIFASGEPVCSRIAESLKQPDAHGEAFEAKPAG